MHELRQIVKGRRTAQLDKPVVLFLIGARLNRIWPLKSWWWFVSTMPEMLKELDSMPGSGLLWYRTHLSWRMLMVQQYWESFEKLLVYAQDKNGEHFPAWARFMRQSMGDGAIGIWHETYLIEPGRFECIYGNMPNFGLA
ncbi:MAG TPA: DUF4188 domain-containing protein, partial [Rhizomicrobium sp.]